MKKKTHNIQCKQGVKHVAFKIPLDTYNADLKACVTRGMWVLVKRRKVHPDHGIEGS